MGVPLCARCGKPEYSGEVTITISRTPVSRLPSKSLCGVCLLIVERKIEQFLNEETLPYRPEIKGKTEGLFAERKNVFEEVPENPIPKPYS